MRITIAVIGITLFLCVSAWAQSTISIRADSNDHDMTTIEENVTDDRSTNDVMIIGDVLGSNVKRGLMYINFQDSLTPGDSVSAVRLILTVSYAPPSHFDTLAIYPLWTQPVYTGSNHPHWYEYDDDNNLDWITTGVGLGEDTHPDTLAIEPNTSSGGGKDTLQGPGFIEWVQSVVDGDSTNRGWFLRNYHGESVSNSQIQYHSHYASNESDRPLLEIEYVEGTLPQARWDSLALTPPESTIALNDSIEFVANLWDTNNVAHDTTDSVTWSLSDSTLAHLSSGGLFRAIVTDDNGGTVWVRAVIDTFWDSTEVTISEDSTAPTAPSSLSGTAVAYNQINLTWSASSDDEAGVEKYRVYRDSALIDSTGSLSYSDGSLTENTEYYYFIMGIDSVANASNSSNYDTITTPSRQDTLVYHVGSRGTVLYEKLRPYGVRLHLPPSLSETRRAYPLARETTDPDTSSPPPPPPPDTVSTDQLAYINMTSSTAELKWYTVDGATETRVYLGTEPAPTPSDTMPEQVLIATLAGSDTDYTIEKLAADVECFFRVEVDSSGETLRRDSVGRTLGGNVRAPLTSHLREVKGVAPDKIMLTIANDTCIYNDGTSNLDYNVGSNWHAANWTVTRDNGAGASITVENVYRRSIPASQWGYNVGFELPYDDDTVAVNHYLYLDLAENIGRNEVLKIEADFRDFECILPFSDKYLETQSIQLNQVGYHPGATRKYAYISRWMGTGAGLDLSNFPDTCIILSDTVSNLMATREVVFSGVRADTQRSASDSDAGGAVRQISLGMLPESGYAYRISIPGVGCSWRTWVNEDSFNAAFKIVARSLYHQRWHGDLTDNTYALGYPRDSIDHQHTVYTAEEGDYSNFAGSGEAKVDPYGVIHYGYHDAADFDQRMMHVDIAMDLLRICELDTGGVFTDGELDIPESGNGIPDMLDEALYGVRGWMEFQESDGGVRMGCESYKHPNAYDFADKDTLGYWTYARNANHSARSAALFAQASRLVATYDTDLADSLETAAKDAYSWAVSNGATAAQLLWPAGELYRLTDSTTYQSDFDGYWSAIGTYGMFSAYLTHRLNGNQHASGTLTTTDYGLGYYGASGATSSITSSISSNLNDYGPDAAAFVYNFGHAHRTPRGGYVDWGKAAAVGQWMDPLIGLVQVGGMGADSTQSHLNALACAYDYTMGCNPMGRCFYTNMGSRSLEEALETDCLAWIKEGSLGGPASSNTQVPGICLYTIYSTYSSYYINDSYMKEAHSAWNPGHNSCPLMYRHGFARTMVNTTEFTTWETISPQVKLIGTLKILGQR